MASKKKVLVENEEIKKPVEIVSKPEKELKYDPYKGVRSKLHKFIKKGN